MQYNTEILLLNQEVKYPLSFFGNITSPDAKLVEVTWDKVCTQLAKPIITETKDIQL